MVPSQRFAAAIRVITSSKSPNPILPVNYDYYLRIKLEPALNYLPVQKQLDVAKDAIASRGGKHLYGPFGPVLGHNLRVTPRVNIYLDRRGDFGTWEVSSYASRNWTRSTIAMGSEEAPSPEYVVGHFDDGFYSLLAITEDDTTDDQNLECARKFQLLAQAVEATVRHGGSVFEIIRENGKAKLRELLVDLARVTAMPFEGCYQIGSQLLVGPTYGAPSFAETKERVDALVAAKCKRRCKLSRT